MKKTLLVAVAFIAGAASVFGQGAITWGNSPTGFRAPIYGPQAGDTLASVSGQSSLGVPAGATVYTGPLLQGAGFTFAVFAGASSIVDPNALPLLISTTFRTATGNALPAGLVFGSTVTVPGVEPGQQAKFQIRVWDNQGGTITTWAQVTPAVLSGVSPMVTTAALGGIDPVTGGTVGTPATIGWTSFNIHGVPEPTTLALAGLGAAAMLIMRRRK
jgi:hypothetical protein